MSLDCFKIQKIQQLAVTFHLLAFLHQLQGVICKCALIWAQQENMVIILLATGGSFICSIFKFYYFAHTLFQINSNDFVHAYAILSSTT